MNLEQTKLEILKWISSCETDEQLRVIESLADEFIVKRFMAINRSDVIHASAEIGIAIYKRHEEIVIDLSKQDLWKQSTTDIYL